MMHHRNLFLHVAVLGMVLMAGNAYGDGQAKAVVCAACHGPDGNSINPIWPNLAGQGANYIATQLQAFKSGAREDPSMSPMANTVADADVREISEYYAAQAPKISAIGTQDFTAAEKMYRGGDAERGIPACMACHGPTGAGNAPASYPALRGQHAEYTVMQLKAYREGERATDAQGMMRDIAGKLSDADIENLARYLSALH
jgi:cytochrome c553